MFHGRLLPAGAFVRPRVQGRRAGLCPAAVGSVRTGAGCRVSLAWAGGGGYAGAAVNPSMGAWSRLARVRCPAHTARPGLGSCPTRRAHAPDPCRSHPRIPTPANPSTVCRCHGKSRCRLQPAQGHAMRFCRSQPHTTLYGGGRRVAPVGTVKNMDVFDKPTWVKAHCLRGTASRATERTAAGGWAGPRRGIHGVSRRGLPAGRPCTQQ